MNAYNDLTTAKDRLELAGVSIGTTFDTAITNLMVAASRLADELTHRRFYVESKTLYFRGAGTKIFFDEDILTITTLKTDEDGDGTFENTLTENTDFIVEPLNHYPKTWAEIMPQGSYGSFGAGRIRGVELAGVFGYGDGVSETPYVDGGTDVNDASMTAAQTTCTIDDGTKFGAGQTILIDNEQLYISSISTHVLTVIRGVNGTTAATHADDSDVYIYQYHPMVEEAVLIQTIKWWKRKDSGFQDFSQTGADGEVQVHKGLDKDVKEMLTRLIKRNV